MFALRPYQTECVGRVRVAFRSHRRVLLVAPTGAGKTVMFAYIAASAAAKGKRILIVAHRTEIVDQISRSLSEMSVRHGLVMPGHTVTADPVQVGMVQTVARRFDRMHSPDLIVIDEAHHAVAGSWRRIAERWPRVAQLGVTATPERLDGRGLSDAFDHMVVGPTTADLIAGGFLSGFDYYAPPARVDLSSIRSRAGDFAIDQLAAVMDRATITGDAVQHYVRFLNGRPAIAFCVTVDHARHVAEQFRSAGFRAAPVDGKMQRDERRDLVRSLGDGRLNVLTSCELISEGVDVPVVSGAILLRPTKSTAMFLQQIGRCLRLKPDGSRAVILDHVGNVTTHGRPDEPRTWSLEGRTPRAASPRTCPTCYRVVAAADVRRVALECGDDCGLIPAAADSDGAGRPAPEVVDGQLEALDDWTGGIDIARARGDEFKALLQRAGVDETRLRQIARIRKYHHGWVRHILMAAHQRSQPISDFQSREFAA